MGEECSEDSGFIHSLIHQMRCLHSFLHSTLGVLLCWARSRPWLSWARSRPWLSQELYWGRQAVLEGARQGSEGCWPQLPWEGLCPSISGPTLEILFEALPGAGVPDMTQPPRPVTTPRVLCSHPLPPRGETKAGHHAGTDPVLLLGTHSTLLGHSISRVPWSV